VFVAEGGREGVERLEKLNEEAFVFFFTHFHPRSIHSIQLRPARPYYRAHLREGFASFSDEADPARLAQIEARALEDAAWVVAKVCLLGGEREREREW
jgi:hypothetical protein